MTEYTVVIGRATTLALALEDLSAKVTAKIADGWEPYSGITVDRGNPPLRASQPTPPIRQAAPKVTVQTYVSCLQPMTR
jgi:hypothetical protein